MDNVIDSRKTKFYIERLSERGFTLHPENGKIRVSGSESLPDSEREFIRQNKEAILRILHESPAQNPETLTPSDDEDELKMIRDTVAQWPDIWRNQFMTWVNGYQRADRGFGLRVTPLTYIEAMKKTFTELHEYVEEWITHEG